MAKSFTLELFLERIKFYGHNIKPLTQYVNKRTKIRMQCDDCGHVWECVPGHILKGSGCPECARKIAGEKHRLTHEQFIDKLPDFVEVLNKYEKYGLNINCRCKICGYEWTTKSEYLLQNKCCPQCAGIIKYTNETFRDLIAIKSPTIEVLGNYEEVGATGNILCKCKECGHEWYPHVVALKRGQICPKCNSLKIKERQTKSLEQFIFEANELHNFKYDYSEVDYYNNKTKVTIICPIHGRFEQTPAAHLSGLGCPTCSNIQRGFNSRRTNEEFIKIANTVHNNRYTYDKCNYTTKRNSIIVTCPIHGDFEQIAGNHIKGSGCPKCKASKGEVLILKILQNYNIPYKYLHLLNTKINNRNVIVDFVCKYNNKFYIIEYNGIQHYEPVEYFGGETTFKLLQIRDEGLKKLCILKQIPLIEIKYNLKECEIEQLIKKCLEIK